MIAFITVLLLTEYPVRPDKVSEIAHIFQALEVLVFLFLYVVSFSWFKTNWKRWAFWACCIGAFGLTGLIVPNGSPARNMFIFGIGGFFFLGCLQAIRWLFKWIARGWPGRPREGKKTIWWIILKASTLGVFVFSVWVVVDIHALNEHYKEDQRDAMYTSRNGQVVMKYDASKWDIINDEHRGYFKLIRKSNRNIAIYVISTLQQRSLQELVENEKKGMISDFGPNCVYKNPTIEKNPSLAGLHFVIKRRRYFSRGSTGKTWYRKIWLICTSALNSEAG